MEQTNTVEGVDVVIPLASVRKVNEKFANTLYGYFIGRRLPFPIVERYVKNTWGKYGLEKVMMNRRGFFFFKFATKEGMERLLEAGPCMIRNMPLILNTWSPSVDLRKEDLNVVPLWVKLHDVPIAAYSEEGLSLISTKIGEPKMVDSYTASICDDPWGRSNYARALIEVKADTCLKDKLVIAVPALEGEGLSKVEVKIEYDWKPSQCNECKVFGHSEQTCPIQLAKVKPRNEEGVTKDDEGFQNPKKTAKKQGFQMKKGKQVFEYRPVQRKQADIPESSNRTGGIDTSNSFQMLGTDVRDNTDSVIEQIQGNQNSSNVINGSNENISLDDDDVEVVYSEEIPNVKTQAEGASTPGQGVAHG